MTITRVFTIRSVLAGLAATIIMDALSGMARSLELTAPLAPNLIGRWFASVAHARPFHADIAEAPALGYELPLALAGHYAIGVTLACVYLWIGKQERWPLRRFYPALGYGFCTNVLPLLIMFPAMGYGFLGIHGPPQTRLLLSSVINHACYGLGLWIGARFIPSD